MLKTLNDVLLPAKQKKYGVGLFNAVNLELARAVIETAEEKKAPVIVGTAEILLPFGPLKNVADILVPMAKEASVPVVVHYDHGLTYEKCLEALKCGFSSIMYDCSTDPYEENVKKVAEMVKIAHAFGATVEGELGHVGDNEGAGKLNDPTAFYTDPGMALDYVKRTGVDALAIAVGNAHGAYKFPPKLDFERIKIIAKTVKIPLVLHGGSGLSDADFKQAIQCGIQKVNIFTDINVAAAKGAKKAITEGKQTLTDLIPYEIEAVKPVVAEKMELFGSVQKA